MKKNIIIILILSVLSVINWFPVIGSLFFYIPRSLSLLLLFLSYCSPLIAVIYIMAAIYFMIFKELRDIRWGIIIIGINLLYLLWSRDYLDILFHMT